jgi:TonB family protein
VARQTEQKPDDAERLYQAALAAQDPESIDAAIIAQVYAQFLRTQSREDQARDLDARASAIRKAHAPAAPAPPAGVFRMGHGVLAPTIVQKAEPQYSEEARAARLQGTVIVVVVVGTDGLTHDPHILRGLGLGLDENAVEAISQWQFKPGVKDGQPVNVTATIEVNFRLL